MGAAFDKGLELQSNSLTCELKRDGKTVLVGERQGKPYHMKLSVVSEENGSEAHAAVRDWHEYMEHQNARHVRNFLKQANIEVPIEK